MFRQTFVCGMSLCAAYFVIGSTTNAIARTIDFEDLTLPGPNSVRAESFTSGDASFHGETLFECCWSGWLYSNSVLNQDLSVNPAAVPDTDPQQITHRTTAYVPPRGASSTYIVASFVDQLVVPDTGRTTSQAPFVLPPGETILSIEVANTTWAANSILIGDSFGGPFDDDDFFKLTVIGLKNTVELGSVDVLLADGRNVVDDWTEVTLTALKGSDTLRFSLSSSDTSVFGESEFLNTPSFFAVDNIVTTPVPEPHGVYLLLVGIASLAAAAVGAPRKRS